MQIHNTTAAQAVPVRNGVIMLSGYAIRVSVDGRHLRVNDGVGRNRRAAKFAKATSRPKRLVIMGQTGFITLPALRWLHDVGAAFVHLDYDASVLTASIPGLDDARLRRAQALITLSDDRLAMVKDLLRAKLQGQQAVLNSFGIANADAVAVAIDVLERSDTLESALIAEAQAADAYWKAWNVVTMRFAMRPAVPDHWRTLASRRSPLTLRPRNAANPINAVLNYLYTLLEVETRLALISRGLDPGLGLFHTDAANRQSLAADVMEPVRPHVDAYVLNLLAARMFSAKDFVETRDGACRISSHLVHELIATMPMWAQLVAPHAERLARDLVAFAKGRPRGASVPPRFMQGGSFKIRTSPIAMSSPPKPQASVPITQVANTCKTCGSKVVVRKRVYCDACLPTELQRIQAAVLPGFMAAGAAKLARMRAEGLDPGLTPEAQRSRAETASRKRRAVVAWADDGALDDVDFARDILPQLQNVSVRQIATIMECTPAYASKVRLGRLTPHKRHWKQLEEVRFQPVSPKAECERRTVGAAANDFKV